MSIIDIEMRRLDNINKAYQNTSGEVKEMWRKKWYELVKHIGRKIYESERLTANTRKIH
jgi:tetrahydromethanopterin S-methyltransferase subunit G